MDGAYGIAESRKPFPFLPSLALLAGVEGPPVDALPVLEATAVGEALKNRCECLPSSSMSTTTTAAPAVYANTGEVERQSKNGGEDTVVPIIFFNDNANSLGFRFLFEGRGVRGNRAGLDFNPRLVFAAKVLEFIGVEAIIDGSMKVG